MNKNDNIKKNILESIILICLMVTYIIYGIQILPLLIFFIPIPFVVVGIRNGIKINIINIVIVSFIISYLLDITTGISLLFFIAPISISFNYCIKTRKRIGETLIISTLALFTSFLVLFIIEKQILNINIMKAVEEMIGENLSTQIAFLRDMGMTNYEILENVDFYEATYKTVMVLIPSLMVVFSLIITYVNLLLTSTILRKMGFGAHSVQKFSKLKLPSNIVSGIGMLYLLSYILIKTNVEYSQAFLSNLTFLTGFIFFLQGLAVLDFLLIRTKIKRFFRFLILGLNILFLPMSSIFFLIGLLDQIFDLRKIRKQKSQ